MIKEMIKDFVPPIIFRNLKIYKNKKTSSLASLSQYKILNSSFKMLFSSELKEWSSEMISNNYDGFIYSFIQDLKLDSAVALDIGAHIGYHTLKLSEKTGSAGKVFAFEPNPTNKERLDQNLDINPDIKRVVSTIPFALSDMEGEAKFCFSRNIEEGFSSGSHLVDMETPLVDNDFNQLGFEEKSVKLTTLDIFISKEAIDINQIKFVKIDVEGAETAVLKGAKNLIENGQAWFVIEIHSILNMYNVFDIFTSNHYSVKILKAEEDGRLIVGCKK